MPDYTITKEDVVRVLGRVRGPGPRAKGILLNRLDAMFANLTDEGGEYRFADVRDALLSAADFEVKKAEMVELSNIANARKRGEDLPQDGVSRVALL